MYACYRYKYNMYMCIRTSDSIADTRSEVSLFQRLI